MQRQRRGHSLTDNQIMRLHELPALRHYHMIELTRCITRPHDD
jgi:hypothetical protein